SRTTSSPPRRTGVPRVRCITAPASRAFTASTAPKVATIGHAPATRARRATDRRGSKLQPGPSSRIFLLPGGDHAVRVGGHRRKLRGTLEDGHFLPFLVVALGLPVVGRLQLADAALQARSADGDAAAVGERAGGALVQAAQ